MALTLLSTWAASIAIGGMGGTAALSWRWVRVLAWDVVAGIYTITLLAELKSAIPAPADQATDVPILPMMLSLVVMWLLIGIGSSVAMWRQRSVRLQLMSQTRP